MVLPVTPPISEKILRQLKTLEYGIGFCNSLEDLKANTFKSADLDVWDFAVKSGYKQVYTLAFTDIPSLSKGDKDALRNFVTDVSNAVHSASVIKIKMSFLPASSFISDVYELFLDAGLSNFLLDIDISATAHNGAQVFVNGTYIDATISTRLKTYFEGHKDVFANIL